MPLKITCKKTGHVFSLYDFKSREKLRVEKVHSSMDRAVQRMHRNFADGVDGFALVTWSDDSWSSCYVTGNVGLSSLPEVVQGMLRREIACDDTKRCFFSDGDEDEPDGAA